MAGEVETLGKEERGEEEGEEKSALACLDIF